MESSGLIAMLTDFGSGDYFIGVVKGVIKSINPGAAIVDLCNDVTPFSLLNAHYILYSSYRYFPEGTIFYLVVDPGVGTDRDACIAIGEHYRYIFPDNGVISPVRTEKMRYYRIDNSKFSKASSTFHGRDIFAPVAARLSLGDEPEELADPIERVITVKYPEYTVGKGRAICQAQHIDTFGNVITTLPSTEIADLPGGNCTVRSDRFRFDAVGVHTYADISPGRVGLIQGSSGFLELSSNKESLSDAYKIAIGDTIEIQITI